MLKGRAKGSEKEEIRKGKGKGHQKAIKQLYTPLLTHPFFSDYVNRVGKIPN